MEQCLVTDDDIFMEIRRLKLERLRQIGVILRECSLDKLAVGICKMNAKILEEFNNQDEVNSFSLNIIDTYRKNTEFLSKLGDSPMLNTPLIQSSSMNQIEGIKTIDYEDIDDSVKIKDEDIR